MKVYIKYMVSNHCKVAVREVLKELGLHFIVVDLGEVDLMEDLTEGLREKLKAALLKKGFELMDDKRAILIERIKNVIIEMIYYTDEMVKVNFSVF